jgi:uncharacterized protein (DUF2252 family)
MNDYMSDDEDNEDYEDNGSALFRITDFDKFVVETYKFSMLNLDVSINCKLSETKNQPRFTL